MKTKSGKELERFVAAIEEMTATEFIDVEINRKEFLDSGVQRIEYDIVITDSSTKPPKKCLVECRDRPSQGPADGAWIEQMYGRKQINGFDRVIAVSSTGFSQPAEYNASEGDIELRSVSELPKPVGWLCSTMTMIVSTGTYRGFKNIRLPKTDRDLPRGFSEFLKSTPLFHKY